MIKRIIFKTFFFVAPVIALYFVTNIFYSKDKGDLLRLGYVSNLYNYDSRELFKKEVTKKVNFSLFSELKSNNFDDFQVFIIGDSFSEKDKTINPYQNFFVKIDNFKVLQLDQFLHDNPIETVYGFLNSGVLKKSSIQFIILQSVERSFVLRGLHVNKKHQIRFDSLASKTQKHKKIVLENKIIENKIDFFSRDILKFPLYNFYYNFDDHAFFSDTYLVKTKSNLFATNNHKLLFYKDDYKLLEVNNKRSNIDSLNNQLNMLSLKLKENDIKLIVLPSPDKFDFYYDDIINKEKYIKPIFFDYIRNLKKDYFYIDTKKLLLEKSKNIKDVYFYDDTHWSPIASKIVANELEKIMVNDQKNPAK